jgi:hypothetical protein
MATAARRARRSELPAARVPSHARAAYALVCALLTPHALRGAQGGERKGLGLLGAAAASSAANLLSRPPWDLLGHGGTLELPPSTLREPAALAGAKDAAGALRVIGRAGVVRTWLRLDAAGDSSTLHLDKHGVAQRCAIPLRDLRILEPGLTTSCAPRSAPLTRCFMGAFWLHQRAAHARGARAAAASPPRCCAASAPWSSTWST